MTPYSYHVLPRYLGTCYPPYQRSNIEYFHCSCGMSLYLILVGCFLLAGKTFRIYKSPTLIFSYLGFSPSSTQEPKTSRSASGSIVRKKGSEYRSRPVLLRTRWTVAGNWPFDCRSRYCPTLHTNVPGLGGASTQRPSWLSTSRAGTLSWRTSVSPRVYLVSYPCLSHFPASSPEVAGNNAQEKSAWAPRPIFGDSISAGVGG